MKPIVYSQRLEGQLTTVAPGVLDAALTAVAHSAAVEAQLSFGEEHSFRLDGEMRFEDGDTLRFRTLGSGRLDPATAPGLRRGTAVLEVVFVQQRPEEQS